MKQKLKDIFSLFFTFLKIGVISFGGGYGMISVIEREVVEKKNWITSEQMLNIIAIAESTPGPIAVNTATFIGVKRCGVLGGIIATLGVILAPMAIIIGISFFYNSFITNQWVAFAFKGIRVAVVVLILSALIKFIKGSEKTVFAITITVSAFLIAVLTDVDVIILLLAAAATSLIYNAISVAVQKRREEK